MDYFLCKDVADSMRQLTYDLINYPEFITSPRNQKIYENIGCSIEIEDVRSNLFINKVRSTPLRYLADELILYFSGESSLKKYSKASSFWNKLYPESYNGAVNSAYGNLIFNNPIAVKRNEVYSCSSGVESQWIWAINSLIKDKDTRQAIIHFNRPDHQYEPNGDFVCTLTSQFFIRHNKLIMITNMRSQDIHFGYSFDIVFFTLLMQCMRLELLNIYPDLELGHYIHNVGSLHMYERNIDLYKEFLKYPIESSSLPEIKENPILHDDIILMNDNKSYSGDNLFFKWLEENRSK